MARTGLGRLLGRQGDAGALVGAIADALGEPLCIEDADGRLLHGLASTSPGQRHAVTLADAPLGWVTGAGHARTIAVLLEHLAAKDAERKALGAEVLHLYREVNLIYSFSEKLAALIDVGSVARLTLNEARHLIVATDGVILLLDGASGALGMATSFGDSFSPETVRARGVGILGAVAATGVAEIVDAVPADPRALDDGGFLQSVIAAPLKVGERVTGVIALASTQPLTYTAGELKLLSTLALQAGAAIENARLFELHNTAEVARARLESELDLAAKIQADLFPSELPVLGGYDLAARNRPARQCGGDYYDAVPFVSEGADDRVLLCVADVSGKGLPASLLMSNIQATLRALIGRVQPLPLLASRASELLYASTSPSRYVTAALLDLDPVTGHATYVGAGHVDSLILRGDGAPVRLCSTGTPLGLIHPGLPYGEIAVTLQPGDCLVLYSDGVVDAQDAEGDEFGEGRLHQVLAAYRDDPPEALLQRVFAAVDHFVGETPQFDDITLMVLRRQGVGRSAGSGCDGATPTAAPPRR